MRKERLREIEKNALDGLYGKGEREKEVLELLTALDAPEEVSSMSLEIAAIADLIQTLDTVVDDESRIKVIRTAMAYYEIDL